MPFFHTGRRRPAAMSLAVIALSGCASFSPDGGLDAVSSMTRERIGQPVRLSKDAAVDEAELDALLGKPLSADSAVRIALINNRGLKASLAELGMAEADLVQAGRLTNPALSFGRISGGGQAEIDRSVMFDLAGLLTMPARRGIERRRFEQAKLLAAAQAVQLAADTRRAYFMAVSAQQTARFMEQVSRSAEASAELAQRMAQAGNWSKLDQARERAFYNDAMTQSARARHGAVAAREQLIRRLGLEGRQAAFTLPERLPDLPAAAKDMNDAEAQAMSQRLDVQLARRAAEASADALGLSKATGFINVLDAGYANKSMTGTPTEHGYQVTLELPIFNWGGARTARAEAQYMQAVHRTADAALRARSEVREAYSAYRSTYELARRYRDDVVPLRKQISDEVLLRYNGMLASVFELLADSREQIASVNAAIEAQRDFWIAETDLQSAINGSGSNTETRIIP